MDMMEIYYFLDISCMFKIFLLQTIRQLELKFVIFQLHTFSKLPNTLSPFSFCCLYFLKLLSILLWTIMNIIFVKHTENQCWFVQRRLDMKPGDQSSRCFTSYLNFLTNHSGLHRKFLPALCPIKLMGASQFVNALCKI